MGKGGVNWIALAQDRYRWRTVVNAVMNLRVTQSAGKFLTTRRRTLPWTWTVGLAARKWRIGK